MKNKNKNYLEKAAKFLQEVNVGQKVLLVLSITFALILPLVFIEGMNPVVHKILFVFAVVSAFASGIAVFAYIMYFLFLKKYLDTAGTVIDATGTAIDTVAKVKDVHKLIKAPNFTKAKEVISKVKDFKMPKLEIKKPNFKSLGDSIKGWFKKKKIEKDEK